MRPFISSERFLSLFEPPEQRPVLRALDRHIDKAADHRARSREFDDVVSLRAACQPAVAAAPFTLRQYAQGRTDGVSLHPAADVGSSIPAAFVPGRGE